MLKNITPEQELAHRWDRCKKLLQKYIPQAEGVLVFSRLNIYYFSGSFANGVLWLPIHSPPVLFCRRGQQRATIESPLKHIYTFRSYQDIETILTDAGFSLSGIIAAEMNGLSWALSNSLVKYLPDHQFFPADRIIGICRSKKSAWELRIIREGGRKHAKCLTRLLPSLLHEGMSELEISHTISKVFFAEGNLGIMRMENFGEEVFLGHISVGASANYPSVFNGPVGLRGAHPATPHMGSPEVKWTKGTPLTIDNGFNHKGYITDKTQVYWLGGKNSIPEKAREAHEFCIELQNRIAERLRPGELPSEIWNFCLAKVSGTKWDEGFMGLGPNKVSFAGHGIGLAVDEYPVLSKGFDVPLEQGMVIAVEPKIGIPGFGMVGVENTFEVTNEGGKSLTGKKFEIITV